MASVPSDMLEQWFSITSEQVFEPSWREFYVEKDVVQREWAFRYINDPGGAAWLDLSATAYSAHPLSQSHDWMEKRYGKIQHTGCR